MKKTAFILFALFVLGLGVSRAQGNFKVKQSEEAKFPAGKDSLARYLQNNIEFSRVAILKKVEGHVELSIRVNFDSSVVKVKVLKGLGYGIDPQIAPLIEKLKFAPAVANGTPIASNMVYSLPLRAYKIKKE